MDTIELMEPQIEYADEIWQFRQEIIDCDADKEDRFAGCFLLDTSASAEEWIDQCRHRKSENTCGAAEGMVPSHTYMGVRKSDNKVIGIIDLRHHINHPVLGSWGGHCGYSVRPSERGKGYAKEMLRLNIINAKLLGIQELLITCDAANLPSEKTIVACGGVFEKTVAVDGRMIKRYWIAVTEKEVF
ncbi:MAG: GNAT family N-acetyltransferase [Clostridia bacterium]|nr:GNAT family N-acetyltransferase [Clostridia bacterium]